MSALDQWEPPAVACRHGSGLPAAAGVGGVLAFGWWYGRTHPGNPHHPVAKPAAPVIVNHTIIRVVLNASPRLKPGDF